MIRVICYVIGFLIVYLLQAFIAWDFSIGGYFESDWGRIAFIFLLAMAVAISEFLYMISDDIY